MTLSKRKEEGQQDTPADAENKGSRINSHFNFFAKEPKTFCTKRKGFEQQRENI